MGETGNLIGFYVMTVATASLENLIPNVPKWEGFITAPVRVPAELKDWVISMVNQKVQQLRVMIGGDTPADQTEDQWVNEVLGLPANHKPGDPLPTELATAIEDSKAERAAADVDRALIEQPAVAASAIALAETIPPEFTRAWLDWAASRDPGFDERAYIDGLKDEATADLPGAKTDLARLVADGVHIGEPLPSQPLTKRQAKQARRLERQKKAAGGKLQTVPADAETSNPLAEQYYKILPVYREQAAERLAEYNAFFDELERNGSTAKIRRFKGYLAETTSIDIWIDSPPYSLLELIDGAVCSEYREAINKAINHLQNAFYTTDKQREESNLDGRFYRIISEIIYCWSMSAAIAEDS